MLWTRHRRPPDATPGIRADFAAAGFEELSFETPETPYVMSVGHHRFAGRTGAVSFDPNKVLFHFTGDGDRPA